MKAKYCLGFLSALTLTLMSAYGQNYDSRTLRNDEAGIVVNNYFYDNYDYYYTSRINRFHRSYTAFEYYSPVFTDVYWYDYHPFSWGVSIYGLSGIRFGYSINFPVFYSWGYYDWYDPYYGYYSPYDYGWYNSYWGSPYYYGYDPFYPAWYSPVVININTGYRWQNHFWYGHGYRYGHRYWYGDHGPGYYAHYNHYNHRDHYRYTSARHNYNDIGDRSRRQDNNRSAGVDHSRQSGTSARLNEMNRSNERINTGSRASAAGTRKDPGNTQDRIRTSANSNYNNGNNRNSRPVGNNGNFNSNSRNVENSGNNNHSRIRVNRSTATSGTAPSVYQRSPSSIRSVPTVSRKNSTPARSSPAISQRSSAPQRTPSAVNRSSSSGRSYSGGTSGRSSSSRSSGTGHSSSERRGRR